MFGLSSDCFSNTDCDTTNQSKINRVRGTNDSNQLTTSDRMKSSNLNWTVANLVSPRLNKSRYSNKNNYTT